METRVEPETGMIAAFAEQALARRPTRGPRHAQENAALVELARELGASPGGILQKLSQAALSLCEAHSAGFSLLDEEGKRFHWTAVVGVWARHAGGGTPRDFGPCGMVLDHDEPMLFWHPESRYEYLSAVAPAIDEGLLLPFRAGGRPIGTIWVISHHPGRRFDAEDLRVMRSLAAFASAAFHAQRESEHRFRDLIDALPVGIYTTDAEGCITHYNPAVVELTGRVPQLGVDRWCPSWKLLRPDGAPMRHDECPMAQAVQEGRAIRGEEVVIERPDGSRACCMPYPTPLRDLSGRLTGAVNMLVDITERKRAEEELKEADRRKDEFMAVLAHELRNPISSIILAAAVLARSSPGSEPARFTVGAIERQAKQLHRLADDLFDMARTAHGKLALELQPVDLLELARSVASDYSGRAPRASLEVSGAPAWVRADPARARQMIENLVDNAFRYGGRRVAIRTLAAGTDGRISVEDDGDGIAPELLGRLFKPFAQGEQPLHRPRGGLGLGLALVERIAAQHGGSVEARSDGPGKGSRFTIALPAAERDERPPADAAVEPWPRCRVLLVEDEDDSRETLKHLLEADGHEVVAADNGIDGLARLATFRPQVALVDLGLPGLDGYEIARRARSLADGAGIRLVAFTGYGEERDRRLAREAGFDLHLTKPLPYETLRGVFRDLSTS